MLDSGEAVVSQELEGPSPVATGEIGSWLVSFDPVRDVGLAKDFGYETIAEGVEDAESLAPLLKEYGVDFAQG